MALKKAAISNSCTKDFNFHTRHLYTSISSTLKELLGDDAKTVTDNATKDFISLFGEDYFDAISL